MERVCPECGTNTEDPTCPNDGEMTLVVKQKKDEQGIIGKVIGGRYRITQVIGQGGFGAVYKCVHTATGDTLAIKVLRTDLEDNLDVVARFRLEAKATSRLKHPNTVRVFDFGQMDDGNLFLAMEFLDGCTLTDLMRREGPLEPERLVRIGLQILKSLSEAHSKGLVHRDLKPDNIFVQNMHGEPDFVRVLDFGIAKSMTADQQDITSTGAVIGTPKYMSPEQARGQNIDQRTDLYSLGIMLFEGISGAPPFVADTPLAMILRRVTEEPPRIHDNLALPTPIALCDAVLKSLRRNPNDRYETADEMAAALAASLSSPLHLPTGQTVGGGRPVESGTASYNPGADDSSDDTFAYDPNTDGAGGDTGASHVVQTGQPGEFDDATAMASADEMAEAAAAMAAADVALDGAVAPGPSGDDTIVSGPESPASEAPSRVRPPQPRAATQAPAPSSKTGLYVGVAVALAVAAGVAFALIPSGGTGTKSNVAASPATAATLAPNPVAAPAVGAVAPRADVAPAAPQLSNVTVTRSPANAIVTIDGVTVMGTKHTLKVGNHQLKVSAPGYITQQMIIQARAGPMPLNLPLKPVVAVAVPVAAAPIAAPTVAPPAHRPTPPRPRRPSAATHTKPAAKKPTVPKPPVHRPKPPKPVKPKDDGLLID